MYVVIVQYLLDCTYIQNEQARCSTRYMSSYFFRELVRKYAEAYCAHVLGYLFPGKV